MNADTFGFKRLPFRSTGIYPGSQQLAMAGALKRALVAPDSVFAVTGPAGVGKSASVQHALNRLDCPVLEATIGRTHVDRKDVLELLLDHFEIDPMPASATRRLDALNQLFHAKSSGGAQVFVIVDDAERLGADALAELESLTASDGGRSPGAHLILLGMPGLESFLDTPVLARLKQRMRRQMDLVAFTESETRSYIEHAISEAGGTLSEVFDDAAIALIHRCAAGVARPINALCEAMLYSASEAGVNRITGALALAVAEEDFGYCPNAAGGDDASPEPEYDATDVAVPDLIQDTQPELPQCAADEQDDSSGSHAANHLEPRAPRPFTRDSEPRDTKLIRALDDALRPDTHLLQRLGDPSALVEDDPPVSRGHREPQHVADLTLQDEGAEDTDTMPLPTLSPELDPDAAEAMENTGNVAPDGGHDTTDVPRSRRQAGSPARSEEKPGSGFPADADPAARHSTLPDIPEDDLPDPAKIPEITLDDSLNQHQQEAEAKLAEEAARIAAAAESGNEADSDNGGGKPTSGGSDRAGRRMQLLSERFSEARSLEDVVDDTAAETLFGEEFSQIAASVAAMAAGESPGYSSGKAADGETTTGNPTPVSPDIKATQARPLAPEPDKADGPPAAAEPLTLAIETTGRAADPEQQDATLELAPEPAGTEADSAAADPGAAAANGHAVLTGQPAPPTDIRPAAGAAGGNATAKAAPRPGGLSSTAAHRLEMVRALNQKAGKPLPRIPSSFGEEIVLGGNDNVRRHNAAKPEPIENQFGVSMTATLKALSAENIKQMQEKETEQKQKKKGGLLGRFRRS